MSKRPTTPFDFFEIWDIPDSLIDYLRQYAIWPAGLTHHGKYNGGLIDHGIVVGKIYSNITGQPIERCILLGLCHDLCKTEDYFIENGVWCRRKGLVGHAERSLVICDQLKLRLTEEERLCIRYHMGAYDREDWAMIGETVKKYPNILHFHSADMIAAYSYGI